MVFAIAFTEEPAFAWEGYGDLHRWGFTILGDDAERFAAPLGYWDEDAYKAQWKQGVQRLVDGAETSCLITRMEEPGDGQVAQFWELYRLDDEIVAVHDRLWVPDFGGLQPGAVYEAVEPYRRESEDGVLLSEWRLPLSDFADYLADQS